MSNVTYNADDAQGMKRARRPPTKLPDGTLRSRPVIQPIGATETWRKQKFEDLENVSPRNTEKNFSGVVVPPTATPSMSALGAETAGTSTPSRRQSHIHIPVINNSLSFPHEHPRDRRSFTSDDCTLPSSSSVGPLAKGPGIASCHC